VGDKRDETATPRDRKSRELTKKKKSEEWSVEWTVEESHTHNIQ